MSQIFRITNRKIHFSAVVEAVKYAMGKIVIPDRVSSGSFSVAGKFIFRPLTNSGRYANYYLISHCEQGYVAVVGAASAKSGIKSNFDIAYNRLED